MEVTLEARKRAISEGATMEHETVEPPYVLVRLVYHCQQRTFSAVGIAKCSPRDSWNEELGKAIARGRAVKEIVRKLRRAETKPAGRVKQVMLSFTIRNKASLGQVTDRTVLLRG